MKTAADLADIATQANQKAQASAEVEVHLKVILARCESRTKDGLFGTYIEERDILAECVKQLDKHSSHHKLIALSRHEVEALKFKLSKLGFEVRTTTLDCRVTFHIEWSR